MPQLRSVVLAGGGTGGHIYPLLAFADCLRRHDPNIHITCLGTEKGLENELIPKAGYQLRNVPAHQLPRKINVDLLLTAPRMLKAMKATREIMDEVGAEVVIGFGGYVAVPAYLAAWRRKTPMVVFEYNDPPGVANKMALKFTDNLALGFPHLTQASPILADGTYTGIPLRPAISHLDRAARRAEACAHFGLDPNRPVLFVYGGSQGAASINNAVSGAAQVLTKGGVQVLHIIGARRDEPVHIPDGLPVAYRTLNYLDRMDLGYAAADMVLARGGSMTVAEVTALGLPTVFVPMPWGNKEQYRNAGPVVAAGGAVFCDDEALNPAWIESNLVPLITDRQKLSAMAQASAGFGRRDGDEALRQFTYKVVQQG
ncbi:UDP-N-acetylglucosamine--N-acetylmuramyl-(pentapeptide) pyrophosphoryl-undecaprenol N-acetylglucosamine transferase [Glycomyces buryatensis]|uniref:UDP-N-acetylglucosamine--N-acetylmuramyl-(pentapeptide) pyrophosphoryl-undecaprenol N-acetylglucosamine transferase n=1 Tax=Glycomyces buryatensis TaxID=2570927 RepID=A0A4S8QE98_9ACTN|nr:UDP-N-acetylglucosamine--N-acetylmuramyl-(pentapeptide) pyrophosphoryl-undecaprenol N-acetylglucosamine transferase [Glycomyces buryatensis]THV39519.1 UDP-N-acetylglucosamine--N-acetylmuramyl-(pentapeptide) pyrophosphoryl-undecaprenol N-acetylglucosamine transferase [Glycomyces buryatensis]